MLQCIVFCSMVLHTTVFGFDVNYCVFLYFVESDAAGSRQHPTCICVCGQGRNRRRGRNITGHRATVEVPGQRGGNILMCAAISNTGVTHHVPRIGPYNFLGGFYNQLIPVDDRGLVRPDFPNYVVFGMGLVFTAPSMSENAHQRILREFFPVYSPFLNSMEEFFSAWRSKVHDHCPHNQFSLLDAMNAGCGDITTEDC